MKFPKQCRTGHKRKKLKEALKLWSQCIKIRDQNRCVICGSTNNVESHHVLTRGHRPNITWLMLGNGASLCFGHHYEGAHSSSNKQQKNFRDEINAILKNKGFSLDVLKEYSTEPLTIDIIEERINYFKNYINS